MKAARRMAFSGSWPSVGMQVHGMALFYAHSNKEIEVIAGTVPQTWSVRVSYILPTTQACPHVL